MIRGGQRYFYLTDAQGSTTALTTTTGAVAATYNYSAFGIPVEHGTVTNPITFAGQPYDPKAGLLFFPLRNYDPSLGRFLSVDPINSPGSRYVYADDDPVNRTDPTGGQALSEYGINTARGAATGCIWGMFNTGSKDSKFPIHLVNHWALGCFMGGLIGGFLGVVGPAVWSAGFFFGAIQFGIWGLFLVQIATYAADLP